MGRRRITRSNKGGNALDTNKEEEDSQMTEATTKITGSKRAPDGSLTPNRNRQLQLQTTDELAIYESMLETLTAQVTPAGVPKAGNSEGTGSNLSEANWPALSSSPTRIPESRAKLKDPSPVARIPGTITEEQVQVKQQAGNGSETLQALKTWVSPH